VPSSILTIAKRNANVLNLLGLIIIGGACLVFIISLLVHNDFWIDEAMLVQTVFTRSFGEIASSPPDYSQNAPLGYLYLLKIFSLVFGDTTLAMRLPSVLASIGVMFFAYRIGKDLFRSRSPLLYAGMAVTPSVVLLYSTQAKQYSFECMCAVIIVWLMGLYCQGRTGTMKLAFVSAILVWFSFTSIFIIFGCVVVVVVSELVRVVKHNESLSELARLCLPFGVTLLSVLANLFFWILPCAHDMGTAESAYWSKLRFPLVPMSMSDLHLLYQMAAQMCLGFGLVGVGVIVLATMILLLLVAKKGGRVVLLSRPIVAIYVALLASLVASNLGFLPISPRIFIFVYPLAMVGIVYTMQFISGEVDGVLSRKPVRILAILLVCVICLGDFTYNVLHRQFISDREQLSTSIEYVAEHKRQEDYIYVDCQAIPLYSYLTDYENKLDDLNYSGDITIGNTIIGEEYYNHIGDMAYSYVSDPYEDELATVVKDITQHHTVWLLFAHEVPASVSDNAQYQLLGELSEYGTVDLEYEYQETPVYLFTRF